MARYPQGVNSYIPTIQPYETDLTMMGKLLSIKQNQYDQNWKKLNDVYSSLYFSPTSHAQSQEVKDQLKQEIDFNLTRISGMDLSLEQNVQAAQQVFQPFYQNKDLMYDMAATKNWNAAKAKGMSYQSSTDPKEQNLWWGDGITELDYRMQEFKNTPYDEIQSTGLAQAVYTPYVDIGKMAQDMAKEFGDMVVKSTSADGKYQITTTNGPSILMQPLAELYQFRMGNNPRVQAMYKTQAYVDRKNWSQSHAGEYGGDVKAAEMAYLENEFKVLQGGIKKTNIKLQKNEKSYNEMQSLLQSALENGTASPEAEKILRQIMSNKEITSTLLGVSNLEKDMVSDGASNGNTSTGKQIIFEGDIGVLRNRVDLLRANSLMMQDFKKAAYTYSKRNMKTETKADEYAIAEFKEKLRAKTEKKLASDKFKVESGIATYDSDGNVHEIKARNDWQSEGPAAGVTAKETHVGEFVNTGIRSEWSQLKPGLVQGLDIATVIGIEGSAQADRITKTLNRGKYTDTKGNAVDKNNKPLTLSSVKAALSSSTSPADFEKQTGLNLGDVSALNSELLDLISNDETVSTLVNSKFQSETDKQKVANWQKEALKDKILLKGIYAEKEWLAKTTGNLLDKANQSTGALNSARHGVDSETGAFTENEMEYYNNALDAVLKDGTSWKAKWLRKYLADQARYNKAEERYAKSADKQWKKSNYLGWAKDKFMEYGNFYKDLDDWIAPDVVVGEIIKYGVVEDYDDVKEAWNNQWKNSKNFLDAPPSSFGSGAGISSVPSSVIVTPANQSARPTQDFYGHIGKVGIYDDYRAVKNLINPGTELLAENPVIFSAEGTGMNALDDDKNTADHQKFVKAIWDAHNDRNLYKKGEGFTVRVSPTTEISGNKAAYTIMPSKAIIDNIIPTGADDDTKERYELIKSDLLTNGATVIVDREALNSHAFESSTTNPIEATLKRKADIITGGIAEEKIDFEPGYGMDFTYNKNTNQYSINHRYKDFDMETYLATGSLVESSVPLQLQNGETLYNQFESYLTSTLPVTKAAVSERVNLIRALKQRKPDITDDEIRRIFSTYDFQYNL